MQPWAFYPAFFATLISLIGWCYLAYREHDRSNPLTLSEIAASRRDTLRYFRIVLWVCGPMFALTMFFFVVPRIEHKTIMTVVWSLTCFGEIVLGVFPAKGRTMIVHSILASIMAFGMLILVYLFWWSIPGELKQIELLFSIIMSALVVLFLVNRKNILFHELIFIFLSHFSVLIAALALR